MCLGLLLHMQHSIDQFISKQSIIFIASGVGFNQEFSLFSVMYNPGVAHALWVAHDSVPLKPPVLSH